MGIALAGVMSLVSVGIQADLVNVEPQACQGCHIDMSHPAVERKTLEACVSCHTGNEVGTGLMTIGHSVHQQVDCIGDKKEADFAPGMHVPMVYETTRIGKQTMKWC